MTGVIAVKSGFSCNLRKSGFSGCTGDNFSNFLSLRAPPKLGRRFPKLADGAQKVIRLKFCAPPVGKKFDLAPSCQGVGPGINEVCKDKAPVVPLHRITL